MINNINPSQKNQRDATYNKKRTRVYNYLEKNIVKIILVVIPNTESVRDNNGSHSTFRMHCFVYYDSGLFHSIEFVKTIFFLRSDFFGPLSSSCDQWNEILRKRNSRYTRFEYFKKNFYFLCINLWKCVFIV